MRKGKIIAGLLTIALCVSPCGNITWQAPVSVNAETQEAETITSADNLSVYRELEDGTVSIVSYFGKPEAVTNDDGSEDNVLTFPDEIDGKTVSGIEGTALDDNYDATQYSNKVILPSGLRTLDVVVFRDCYYIAEIKIAESNESFSSVDGVLYNKDQTKLVRVPECSGSLADFEVPETVKEIGEDAFFNGIGDIKISISKNIEKIGDYAFYRYLGSDGSVTFTVDEGNEHFIAEDGSLYSKDKKVLYRFSSPKAEVDEDDPFGGFGTTNYYSYDIPQGVTTIGTAAFEGCANMYYTEGLAQVTIPDSVTTIGASAFQGCSLLGLGLDDGGSTEVVIPDSVTSIGEAAFRECGMSSVVLPAGLTEIADGVFYNCYSLAEITIPEGVTTIGNSAFYNSGLTKIKLPEGLQEIGVDAFASTSLTQVTIPDQVESIGDGAFAQCGSLEKVVLGKSLKQVGYLAVYGCQELKEVVISDGVEQIGEMAFASCPQLVQVTIPDSVTTIGDQAFGWNEVYDEETGAWKWVTVDDFTLYCTEGSTAAQYAADNSMTRKDPAEMPSLAPSQEPSEQPDASEAPSNAPSQEPSGQPSASAVPSATPSNAPSQSAAPSNAPTGTPVPTSSAVPTKTPDAGANVAAPSAVKLTAVKNVKGKKLQITWKKNAKAAGYQVQYATSAKFKGAKAVTVKKANTTKTVIKKLKKGKKYFVRVRAYVTTDDGKKYSKWSSAKKAVIKK